VGGGARRHGAKRSDRAMQLFAATLAGSPRPGTNGGSTRARDRGTVHGMKPFIIFALWAVLGLDAGAWAEAFAGIPAGVGIIICVGIGAALAVAARQRIAVVSTTVPETGAHVSLFEGTSTLDRAA